MELVKVKWLSHSGHSVQFGWLLAEDLGLMGHAKLTLYFNPSASNYSVDGC